ncbi:dihydropyrimidinase [Parasporobacterium paucivorans]|uniref:Dihydropyrimidinase n=1 Tax=Parasporobacterium paucivorans DSM 15970 TaxID=1122934 RepID=A0A1M6C648_9FIRM|nr:dihydropyrimidinase [Parasporobacterium paucivorans]SHI56486.1 dihydropyrimidinase [Parasporobacterium paucivorans DSM 15970]
METVIKGGMIITDKECFKGDILIAGEKIAAVSDSISEQGREVLDASGQYVFPGFIDAHTHFDLEGACRTADDFYTGTRAAIIGGTTTILDFATQDRGVSSLEALQKWHVKADGISSCDYGFHMSFTEWNENLACELPVLAGMGVTSFKLYMAYKNLMVDDDTLAKVMAAVKVTGGITGVHCEEGDRIDQNIQKLLKEGHTSPRYHPVSRPPETEAAAIRRCIRAAQRAGAPVNIVHLSTKAGLEEVRKARLEGQKVYVETCPQYLLLDDRSYDTKSEFEGAKYVLSPPLRKPEDRESLWKALADNTVNTIGTDHCSFNFSGDKELGIKDFSKIPNGIPGVEHRPALLYTYGAMQGKISLNRMVELLSVNPAKLFGLYPRKGTLQAGSDADIVIWNPESEWEIRAEDQIQNVDYTPYEGMKADGRARTVFLRGVKIVDDYKIISEKKGKYIHRGKSIPF